MSGFSPRELQYVTAYLLSSVFSSDFHIHIQSSLADVLITHIPNYWSLPPAAESPHTGLKCLCLHLRTISIIHLNALYHEKKCFRNTEGYNTWHYVSQLAGRSYHRYIWACCMTVCTHCETAHWACVVVHLKRIYNNINNVIYQWSLWQVY